MQPTNPTHERQARPPPALHSLILCTVNARRQSRERNRSEAGQGRLPQLTGKMMDNGTWPEPMDIDNEHVAIDAGMHIPAIVVHPPSDDDCEMSEEPEDVEMFSTEDESSRNTTDQGIS